jgi:uncharacterized protein (TIGR00299 family) protein
MARVLYFDCFSGAAGDMILAALLDAGLPLEALRNALGSLGVDHELVVERVMRGGIAATHVSVRDKQHNVSHAHQHASSDDHTHSHDRGDPQTSSHSHHEHRTLAEIAAVIDRSGVSAAGKARAKALFQRIAQAEASIHNMPLERVHLHEVGALDSIIDIVGAVFALEWFGADEIVSSPINVGGGTVQIAHGTFPVPAPATLQLLTGVPVYSSGLQAELVTPTGALIISDYSSSFGPLPAMVTQHIGYGAGAKDFPGAPNVLRVVIGERAHEASASSIIQIECEIDDMNPQIFGPLLDHLLGAGALDVFYTPVQMKKNRPGVLITVLAPPDARETVSGILFTETTTIGLRYQTMTREVLDREVVTVETPVGGIRFKVAIRRGRVVNAAPEFEDCTRLAAEKGLPLKEVHALALAAWMKR